MTIVPPSIEQPPGQGFLLEEKKRLSESMLWHLQRQYYDQRGLSAWESGAVPSYVTSNSYIATTYAHVVLAFLRDAVAAHGRKDTAAQVDPTKPIYIVELAAGHGRFSFLFLKKFLSILRDSSLRELKICYVMTDFTENNLRSWLGQPLFKEFLDAGVLKFGLFDIETDTTIKLWPNAEPLERGAVENPLIVIANYIFDTLTQDLFRFEGGHVQEVLVTTRHAQQQAPDLSNPEVMSQFSLHYDHRPIDPHTYYPEAFLNRLLVLYRERLGDTTIALPTGGLRGLFRLLELSGNRLLLISSDKGYTHEDELFFLTTQHIQFHGSLSMMVNYHAIALALGDEALGGLSMATAQRHINLKTAAFLVGAPEEQFLDTLLSFRQNTDFFGPYDFYTLAAQVRQHTQNASIEQILCLLRMSQFDPNIALDYAKELLEQCGNLNDALKQELYVALMRCWENFYPLGRDLPFELARILLALRRPREAVQFNIHSVNLFGQHPVTFGNMGICHYHAEEPEEALRCFDRSLELSPNYGLPKAWKARLLAEMERGSGT
jgi:tetratricopeptide (TPR) repeat protein